MVGRLRAIRAIEAPGQQCTRTAVHAGAPKEEVHLPAVAASVAHEHGLEVHKDFITPARVGVLVAKSLTAAFRIVCRRAGPTLAWRRDIRPVGPVPPSLVS